YMTSFDPFGGILGLRRRGLERWAHHRRRWLRALRWHCVLRLRFHLIRLGRIGFRPDPRPARTEACAHHREVERKAGIAQRTALRDRLVRAEQTHGAPRSQYPSLSDAWPCQIARVETRSPQ